MSSSTRLTSTSLRSRMLLLIISWCASPTTRLGTVLGTGTSRRPLLSPTPSNNHSTRRLYSSSTNPFLWPTFVFFTAHNVTRIVTKNRQNWLWVLDPELLDLFQCISWTRSGLGHVTVSRVVSVRLGISVDLLTVIMIRWWWAYYHQWRRSEVKYEQAFSTHRMNFIHWFKNRLICVFSAHVYGGQNIIKNAICCWKVTITKRTE